MKMFVTAAVTLVVGGLRLALPSNGINPDDLFKDVAHLWVGGLFGAAVAKRTCPLLWVLAGGLTALEVVAFVVK